MSNPARYRQDLPDIPARMLTLTVTRGFPTPWFVAQVNGEYDFRIIAPGKLATAVREHRCWVCGGPLGRQLTFVIGPMCALNRTISEPPSHHDCAEFSALACPFLTQREAARRTVGLPDPESLTKAAGFGLTRQPGVVCLWGTRRFHPFVVGAEAAADGPQPGLLFRIGEPTSMRWYREGREATPAEIWESLASGLPELRRLAISDGLAGVLALEAQVERFLDRLPALRGCEHEREEV
jgi:hypothetical protein